MQIVTVPVSCTEIHTCSQFLLLCLSSFVTASTTQRPSASLSKRLGPSTLCPCPAGLAASHRRASSAPYHEAQPKLCCYGHNRRSGSASKRHRRCRIQPRRSCTYSRTGELQLTSWCVTPGLRHAPPHPAVFHPLHFCACRGRSAAPGLATPPPAAHGLSAGNKELPRLKPGVDWKQRQGSSGSEAAAGKQHQPCSRNSSGQAPPAAEPTAARPPRAARPATHSALRRRQAAPSISLPLAPTSSLFPPPWSRLRQVAIGCRKGDSRRAGRVCSRRGRMEG